MIALLCGVALAAGVHAGIPVRGVPGVGEPTFLTPASGWTAPVEGGWVRVYVGASEAEGAEWYARQLSTLGVAPPPYAVHGADEAHGDGSTLVAWRDGNVGVVVRGSNAGAVATRLHGAIVDNAPAVSARMFEGPDLTLAVPFWTVEAPGAVAIRAAEGPIRLGERAQFKPKPDEVYVWDAYGRVQVVR